MNKAVMQIATGIIATVVAGVILLMMGRFLTRQDHQTEILNDMQKRIVRIETHLKLESEMAGVVK